MSFTEVFGGNVLYPSGQTYLSLTFSVDQQLQWPIEQQVAGNVVSSIMDLDATAAGLNVDIPDARQVSNGIQSVFNNVGANSITIRDAAGGTIISLGSGEAWVVYLTDNSTLAGTWRIFQLGASVSVANASALAGAGLKSIGSTLNQRIAPTSTAVSPVTWVDSDRAQMTIWTGGVGVLNLPTPGTVGSDWFSMVRNAGSGDLTLTPAAGLVDSAATLALAPGGSAIVVTDGTNFFTVGLGQSSSGVFDFIEINVAGSGDFVLSGVQLNRISYRFIGALTGNRNIVVPNTVQQYWIDNSTTGAFSLFANTVGQVTPVEILQGARNITYCDGNDVLQAESSTVSFPISIVQGGTGAITAAVALANLGGVPLTRLLNTNALSGLAGGGDLTADRDFVIDSDNLTTELTVDSIADTIPFYDDSASAMRKTPIASILPTTVVPVAVRKLVATDRSSDIVPTDDPELSLTLPALGVWEIELLLMVRDLSGTSNGIRVQFGLSNMASSPSIWWWIPKLFTGAAIEDTTVVSALGTQDILPNTSGAGTTRLWIKAYCRVSSLNGVIALQWAQDSSNVTAVRVDSQSTMIGRFVA